MKGHLKTLLIVAICGGCVLVAIVALGAWGTRLYATAAGDQALEKESGVDRVEPLIAIVDSEEYTLEERNHAVWALGQLRDERALPVLHKYHTGEACDHERYLCQYELAKSIAKCEGTFVWSNQIQTKH